MKTTYQAKAKDVKREWHLIDAGGEVLGRTSTRISGLLMGKGKVNYTPHMDMGDYVVVINAKNVEVTGKKDKQKTYYSHSGYPQGFKKRTFAKLLERNPEKIIEHAVSGMLPKNRLHKKRMARLKVFSGKNNKYQDKFEEVSK